MCGTRHAHITLNSKFAIFLQFLKKEVSHEVDFLHADNHENLLQIDTMIFISFRNSRFAISFQYIKKEVRDEVDFLHVKYQSFLQIDFMTLFIEVSYKMILSLLMGMIKQSQITQSNKFAISLQYLKKEVKNGVHFLHADKHQSFYKMALSFFMEVVRHVQSTQNRKLVIFLEYIKKKVLQQLLGSILMQNIQIFHGGSVMFVVNCSFRIFT